MTVLYHSEPDLAVYQGDVLETLASLADESVHCVVTSPPYWALRDYGIDGQIGLEQTPELYVARMVEVFREVRRVLRADGTCWLNLGSSYFAGESYPMREIDAAWLAAIIDGEGCVQIHQQRRPAQTNSVDSFQVDVGVGMMTPEVVQRCHAITNLGSPPKVNARGVWDWSVRGQQAAQMLRAIYPYLLTKKKQAALAIMLADDLAERKYGRGNPAQPDVMEWRAQIRRAVSELNQRRGTDFLIVEPRPIALNLKPKDDVGIPHRVYNALRDDGWYARSDIIWEKVNPMPESVTDRPTKAHEYVFLLTKSPRYFYDAEAIREPNTEGSLLDAARRRHIGKSSGNGETSCGVAGAARVGELGIGRNARSVWEIVTQPYAEAHFATFPEELPRRCIAAGTSERGCCPVCGAPWEREIEHSRFDQKSVATKRQSDGAMRQDGDRNLGGQQFNKFKRENPDRFIGWRPTCVHGRQPVPCTVLDPFGGAGTTALVARRLGRASVAVELNPEYAALIVKRLATWWKRPALPPDVPADQLSLLDMAE